MHVIERRRLNAWLARAVAFLFLIGTAAGAAAQQPAPPARLSLDDAIALARRNNPDFQAQKNDAAVADWAVREAYGNLLPGASASSGLSYQAAGTPRFGNFSAADFGISRTPAYYNSDFSLGFNYSLSGQDLLAPGREKTNRRGILAHIQSVDFLLKANVTRQYLAVLRAQDDVTLAQEELKRTDENLKLAQAKVAVGAAVPLEAKQAELERGRVEVNLLHARSIVHSERVRLMQHIGIELDREVELTSKFSVFDLAISEEELVKASLAANPQILMTRASEEASAATVKIARSAYLPTLDFSAGVSGYTRQAGSESYLINQAQQQAAGQRASCEQMNFISSGLSRPLPNFPQDCSRFVLTPDRERDVISGNNVFPFNFSRQPWTAQMRISLPIFQGFGRERQIESARAAAADARHLVRGEELRIRTEISAFYVGATTGQRTVQLELRNRELANESLELVRERYRVGVATFIELKDAETIKARADRAYLNALYTFHEAIASLETAAGRNLRPVGETR